MSHDFFTHHPRAAPPRPTETPRAATEAAVGRLESAIQSDAIERGVSISRTNTASTKPTSPTSSQSRRKESSVGAILTDPARWWSCVYSSHDDKE